MLQKRRPLLMPLLAAVLFAGCDGGAPLEPACTGSVRVTGADSLVLVRGQSVMLMATTSVQCADGRTQLEWVSRDPAVVAVTGTVFGTADVVAVARGGTYVVAQVGGARGVRDSVRLDVLGGATLTVLAGGAQTDTVDALLRDSLVVSIREQATGEPLRGVTVRFSPALPPQGAPPTSAAPVGPGGHTVTTFVDTTDAEGRAATAVRLLGPAPGTAMIGVSTPALGLSELVSFHVLPGRPARVRVVPRDSVTLVGATLQLQTVELDRRGNVIGPAAATYSLIPPSSAVDVTAAGLVTGLRFGQSPVLATAAHGTDTALVRVFPPNLVAGRHATGFAISRLDGSGFALVPNVAAIPNQGRVDWSPDGSTIAYVGHHPGSMTPHVFLARADGSSRPLVPAFENSPGEMMPRYSPDGAWVYFSARNAAGGAEIWRADAATGQPERIGEEASSRHDLHPSVSHDGRYVAYVRGAGVTNEIVILDLTTRAVTSTGQLGSYVTWSPVEPLLAFTPGTSPSNPVTLMRPNGSIVTTHWDRLFAPPYAWSPDGRLLLRANLVMDAATGGVISPSLLLFDSAWRP